MAPGTMAMEKSHIRAFALLGVVMLFWAGNSIVGRAVHGDVPPLTLAFLRWAGACTFVAPFAIRQLRRDWPALVAGWKPLLVLGLLGVGAFNAFLYTGLNYTTATNALLLQAAIPALVALLDRIIFGVRGSAVQTLAMVASITGVVVIVFEGDPHAATRLHLGRGDALVLAAVVVWSLYTVLLRLRPRVSPTSFIAATFAIGAAAMAPFALWEWQQGMRIAWSGPVVAVLLYVAVLPSIVSYYIYNAAAQEVGPARAGLAITMMPVFGAFLSAALLGEALHPYHALGIVLICAGIGLAMLALHKAGRGAAGDTAPEAKKPGGA